jgi:hypothetical protein
VPPAIAAPILLACVAIALAISDTLWFLLALPFIYLGSVCAAPNLNLADGFPAIVAVFLGLIVTLFKLESGAAIAGGTTASLLLSALEKRLRAKPVSHAPKAF